VHADRSGEILVAMSREDVELVRRMYVAFATQGREAAVEYLHPDIEWLPPADAPTAGTYRGLDQVRAQLEDWTEQFSGYAWEPHDFSSAPGGRVVVVGQQHGTGVVSGADVQEAAVHVWTVRDGRAIRLEMYHSRAAALQALGLAD
jgi:uncharacterized protein